MEAVGRRFAAGNIASGGDPFPLTCVFTGDGAVGQDISGMIPYLRLPPGKGFVVRGEFIISRANFAKHFQGDKNARNTVAGLIGYTVTVRLSVSSCPILYTLGLALGARILGSVREGVGDGNAWPAIPCVGVVGREVFCTFACVCARFVTSPRVECAIFRPLRAIAARAVCRIAGRRDHVVWPLRGPKPLALSCAVSACRNSPGWAFRLAGGGDR